MITNDVKQLLIKAVADNLKIHKANLAYTEIVKVLEGTAGLTPFEEAAFCIEASVICHGIPLWENNQPIERLPNICFSSAITFTNTFKDETELQKRSQKGFGQNVAYTNFELPALSFGDDTHDFLHPGVGSGIPDFIGSDNKTYEAKYRYQKGSPSSLHNADFLINCENPGISVYEIPKHGTVDTAKFPLARYTGILSRRLDKSKLTCGKDYLELITSGELIYEIEKLL